MTARRPRRPARQALTALLVGGLSIFGAGALPTAVANSATPGVDPLAPTTPGAMHRYAVAHAADDWKKAGLTQTQANDIAQRFDLMVVAPGEFDAFATQMHAANPNLKMLVYLNGTYLPTGQAGQYTEDQFAHTSTGARINQALTWGNYLMNVASPTWATSRANLCKRQLLSSHADGCYLDMMGPQPLNPGYNTGRAVDPSTGKIWTYPNYMAAVAKIADSVRAANAGIPLAGNGLADGVRYYAPKSSRLMLSYVDAGHAEIWLREGRSVVSNWPTVDEWKKDVDMLAEAGAAGETVLTQTKVWTTASAAQLDQWHRFALASFLLGTDGSHWFEFSSSRTLAGVTVDSPYDRVDVGTGAGSYSMDPVSGAYVRSFTQGYAAVNPADADVTVTLPVGCTDLDGNTSTGLPQTLAAHSGQVCTLPAP